VPSGLLHLCSVGQLFCLLFFYTSILLLVAISHYFRGILFTVIFVLFHFLIVFYALIVVGRDSVAGMVTRYWLDGPGIKSQ
jgi:hypothetical protein